CFCSPSPRLPSSFTPLRSPLSFRCGPPQPGIRSFPTRRSSDLCPRFLLWIFFRWYFTCCRFLWGSVMVLHRGFRCPCCRLLNIKQRIFAIFSFSHSAYAPL